MTQKVSEEHLRREVNLELKGLEVQLLADLLEDTIERADKRLDGMMMRSDASSLSQLRNIYMSILKKLQ